MVTAIILTAVGTNSEARTTYAHLKDTIHRRFPDADIFTAYSSPIIRKKLTQAGENPPPGLRQLLTQLQDAHYQCIVIQALLLFPGSEFHRLLPPVRNCNLPCSIGLPLLCSPADYHDFGSALEPVIDERKTEAILLLGHGTTHPSWTAYSSLEKLFRERFGQRIFVGVIENYPPSDDLIDRIVSEGYSSVYLVPLFLVAGVHYHRDIWGQQANTWRRRLQAAGLGVESMGHGIGLLPGIETIFCRHISEAVACL